MIRKHFPRFLITPRVGQLGILGGILHVLMAHPVLHEVEFSAGVEEVGGDGMLETMELPFLRRQPCSLAIGLHRAPQRAPVNGYVAVGDEEIRGGVGPHAQVRTQEHSDVGLQGVDAREGPFPAVDADPPLLQVDVGALKEADL